MSTKSTIIHGPNFHLYDECLEEGEFVYLELEGIDFECTRNSVTVPIPAAIWQSIRRHKIDLSLAPLSDADFLAVVEREVDQNITEYQDHAKDCEKCKRGDRCMFKSFGCMVFGSADSARDEQIKGALMYYARKREQQVEIVRQMKTHEAGGLFAFNFAEGTSERVSVIDLESN